MWCICNVVLLFVNLPVYQVEILALICMGDSNSAASVAQLVEHVHVHVYTCTLYMYIHVHCTCTMYSVHLEHIELVQVKSHFRQLWNLGSVLRFSESVNVSCTLVHSAVYMYMYMYSTYG